MCVCLYITDSNVHADVFPHSANSNRTSYINCHQLSDFQASPFSEFKEKQSR